VTTKFVLKTRTAAGPVKTTYETQAKLLAGIRDLLTAGETVRLRVVKRTAAGKPTPVVAPRGRKLDAHDAFARDGKVTVVQKGRKAAAKRPTRKPAAVPADVDAELAAALEV
jgi:hypothetical protein